MINARRNVMKKCATVFVIAVVIFSIGACKKKEEEKVSQPPIAQGPIVDSPALSPHKAPGQKIQFEVVVPPDVEAGWSAVKLLVEDKKANKTEEYTVQIGEELQIPDSKLMVQVVHFLPDFKMSGPVITSDSNNPNNPSVGVTILEDGKKIFPGTGELGWLYSKFPTIHPFQHERFGITLQEGVEKQ
jgi:hypothetical protein